MKRMFGSTQNKTNKAAFYIEALKKGRAIRPNECFGIGNLWNKTTCAGGAIALGLGYSGLSNTSDVWNFMKGRYPEFPIDGVIIANDGAEAGTRDTAVLEYLNEYFPS